MPKNSSHVRQDDPAENHLLVSKHKTVPYPLPDSCRAKKTVHELAMEQGVKPVTDPRMLLGQWPGEIDDGFEEFLAEIRQSE